jgi:hypothetical protein
MSGELPSICPDDYQDLCLRLKSRPSLVNPSQLEVDQLIDNQYGIKLVEERTMACIRENQAECALTSFCIELARFIQSKAEAK